MVCNVNKDRMLKTLIEVIKIDSLSYKEHNVAKYLKAKLKRLGGKVTVDNAHKKTGGTTGNVISFFKGAGKNANSKPLLIGAHMDTVTPGTGIKPIKKGNTLCTDGSTILGADNKAGMAITLELLQVLKEKKLPHPPIYAVYTTAEEPGVVGVRHLDYKKLKNVKSGILLDWLDLNEVLSESPTFYQLDITIHGRASHGAAAPEKGISALEIASMAITKSKFGWLDKETTCNLGLVKGGTTDNTVMSLINLKGDIRSHNTKKLEKNMAKLENEFKKACKAYAKKIDGKMITPKLEFKKKFLFKKCSIPPSSLIVKTIKKSAKKHGVNLKFIRINGVPETAIYSQHGIYAPCMGCGTKNVHTTREQLDLKQFYKCAEIVLDAVSSFRQ
ncbi:MAG TPA: M20/M25/M40 family metallo-hydrolase [Elusimicrobiales bacterium]|nr:M20/M25/M40 family metallo-hydrolase [Elusimicrobiales bacterium]